MVSVVPSRFTSASSRRIQTRRLARRGRLRRQVPQTRKRFIHRSFRNSTPGTSVPILLPNNLSMVVSTLYASILDVSSTQYAVFVDARPKCFGATACEQIYVAGQSLSASPTPSPLTGTPTQLSNGIMAYFTQATCGASCGYSNLSWNSGSFQYTLGIKGGSPSDLLNAANSMTPY
jgi:hypothetical protein